MEKEYETRSSKTSSIEDGFCPWCGSERKHEPFSCTTMTWVCGSSIGCAHQKQSEHCKWICETIDKKVREMQIRDKEVHAESIVIDWSDTFVRVYVDGKLHTKFSAPTVSMYRVISTSDKEKGNENDRI